MPWRAIAVGSALIPVNAFWLAIMECGAHGSARGTTYQGPYPSTLSLFANVICFIVALTAVNAAVGKVRPGWVLTQAELLVVYMMLSIGTCILSIDFVDVLVPMMGHATHYATPSNNWKSLFMGNLPSWFHVTDAEALKGWYEGHSDPYTWRHIHAWLLPMAAWSGFIIVMLTTMLCINVVIRLRWTQHERLSYPIIQLPMDMTEPGNGFYKRKLMWAGFAVAAAVDLLNGLNVWYPGVPGLPIKAVDLSPLLPNKPWNTIGYTPLAFYPFAIGLGFLLPADLLFSSWFFCLVWRAERVISSYYGWSDNSPNFPYVNEQSLGAYIGVALLALWGLRKHIAQVVREAWQGAPRDVDEPMGYRMALVGAAVGLLTLGAFFHAAGLPIWMCVAAFLLYFLIAIACTRMRAELGPPAHDLHNGGPDTVIPNLLGTQAMGVQTLTALTWFWWFNRAYRSIAMPYQLEAFKLGERKGIPLRGVALALTLAAVLGTISAFWSLFAIPYRSGAEPGMASHFTYFGWEAYNRLTTWISMPRQPEYNSGLAILLGLAATITLHVLRMRMAWMPLHPLGLAVSGSFSMSTLWVPILIAWICKVSMLRYRGLDGYRKAVPFFLGLILGDYLIGCAWALVGWALGVNTYSYYF